MSKIQAGKPVGGTQFGTTLSNSTTHAPTLKGSSTSPKAKTGVNGIMSNEPQGTTFVGNKSKISTPTSEAHGAKSSKVKSSGTAEKFIPKGTGTLSKDDTMVKNPPVKGRR